MANVSVNDQSNTSMTQVGGPIGIPIVFRPVSPISPIGIPVSTPEPITNPVTAASSLSTGSNPSGANGIPLALLTLFAVQSPIKQQSYVDSDVTVSFTRNASDANFYSVQVWFTGYHGNPNPTLMASGSQSPIQVIADATNETVGVYAQTVSSTGAAAPVIFAKHTTVTLNGVVGAPPAPTISQGLVGTSTGYQFGFYQVVFPSGDEEVISNYNIYRGTSNTASSASLLGTMTPNPGLTGTLTYTDTIVPAAGLFYYYFVSAVNTSGYESTLTPAQTGQVAGAIGSVPPTIASGFTYISDTSSITWSWQASQAILRADGTTTIIGAGSQGCTGLNGNEKYFFYPVYDETAKILRFIGSADVTELNITGVTLNGTNGEVTTTTAFVANTSFTLEAWFKTTSSATNGIVTHAAAHTGSITAASTVGAIYISGGLVIGSFVDTTAATQSIASTTKYNDGAWHHVVYVVIGSANQYLYVDSTQVDAGALTTNPSTASDYLRIGRSSSNNFLNGTVAYVAYYPTALSAIAILNHYSALTTIGAAAYDTTSSFDVPSYQWYLNETSGTSAADSAGSNTGTYTGTFTLNQSSAALSALGTPSIAWSSANYLALQAQNLRNNVPLSTGSLLAATTVSGAGGGGGGGTGGGGGSGNSCFSPNTRLYTQRGCVRFDELQVGDCVLTARGTWCKVTNITCRDYAGPMLDMGMDELVTPTHLFRSAGRWAKANECINVPTVEYAGTIWNAHIETGKDDDGMELDTEHSYTLANGITAHNVVTQA